MQQLRLLNTIQNSALIKQYFIEKWLHVRAQRTVKIVFLSQMAEMGM